MLLKCKACGAALSEDRLDLERGLASCRYCGAVLRVRKAAPSDAPPPDARETEEPIVPLPERFRVEESDGGLKITRPWFSPAFFFLLPFCIAWDSFLVFWYSMAVEGDAPWIFFVFPVAHLAVGVGLTYLTIGGFVNRTVVSVRDGRLGVWNGPLPWIGNLTVETDQVDQIYCYEKSRSGKNGSHTDYQVYAVTKGGRRVQLLVGLPEAAQAIYVERRLEERLGIKDRPVAGELPR